MSILVTGGTGTVGSEVVRLLAERKEDVRVLVRTEEKKKSLPDNVCGVIGDLDDQETLGGALLGIDKLFLLTPLSPNEEKQGKNAVAAARDQGVEQIVFMSVHDVEKVPEAPHFKSKIEIQKEIVKSGLPWTLIMPNNFFQNDLWFREAMLSYGVYPQPIGSAGMSRVDTRDIAEACVNALTQPGHAGKRYALAGPEALTADDTVSAWSRALGKEIRYGGDDLEAWAAQSRQMMPDWLVDDLKIMYAYFLRQGLRATDDDLAQTRTILGRAPRRFEDFVEETSKNWRK